jgi:hypothetical protein
MMWNMNMKLHRGKKVHIARLGALSEIRKIIVRKKNDCFVL